MKSEDAVQLLKQNNLRITGIRQSVLSLFLETDKALSQQDIDQKLPESDRVTIYRTLKTFEEKGLIHQAVDNTITNKFALCPDECTEEEHVHDHEHAHFHCNYCGVTYCVDDLEIPAPPKKLGKARVDHAYMVLEGLCADCNN